jgi:uncharacterized protein YprB with RNaseH-like and TPR domain
MLNHTFCHIPGIGRKTEEKLWASGVISWEDWREPLPIRLPITTRIDGPKIIGRSIAALAESPGYFSNILASYEAWRLFPHYRDRTVYLDIETTGLHDFAEVTTIAMYDGHQVFTYVNGENLDNFLDDIFRYQVIVSYNGKSFDIPFLERFFRTPLPHAQIDLRHILARLGFKGGLKGCEKQLGMNRGNLDGVDGYFAVLLWREYQASGDRRALETLLAYNIEDTVNLERLMVEAYNRNLLATPFSKALELAHPLAPPNPFVADSACVDRLKRHLTDRYV